MVVFRDNTLFRTLFLPQKGGRRYFIVQQYAISVLEATYLVSRLSTNTNQIYGYRIGYGVLVTPLSFLTSH